MSPDHSKSNPDAKVLITSYDTGSSPRVTVSVFKVGDSTVIETNAHVRAEKKPATRKKRT